MNPEDMIQINQSTDFETVLLNMLSVFAGIALAFSMRTLAKRTVVMTGLWLNPHIKPGIDTYVDGRLGRIEKIGLFSTVFRVEVGGDVCKRVVSNDHMDWVHLEVIQKRKSTSDQEDSRSDIDDKEDKKGQKDESE